MKRREIFCYGALYVTFLLLTAPGICADWDDGMEILMIIFRLVPLPDMSGIPVTYTTRGKMNTCSPSV